MYGRSVIPRCGQASWKAGLIVGRATWLGLALLGSVSIVRAENAVVTYKTLTPDVAVELAQAALKRCRADGYQVAVAVVDRFGRTQVMIRDRFAGLPAPDTAVGKAWTAVSFRANTGDLVKSVKSGELSPELARLPHVVMLAGGVMIESAGTLLGAVGVSGAPGGDKDEACAAAGLDAIRDKLEF